MTTSQKQTLKEHILGLVQFFEKEGYSLKPYPKVVFYESNNPDDIKDPTGNYQPGVNTINLYCNGRHQKDVFNTFAHELVHKWQDTNGRLDHSKLGESTNYTNGNDYLKEIEHEAFVLGNVMRRKYTESLEE